jgi:hypothetical protein
MGENQPTAAKPSLGNYEEPSGKTHNRNQMQESESISLWFESVEA